MFDTKPVTPILTALFGALILLSASSTAIAQVEPQQGAINTTRSNLKNTFREIPPGGLPIKGVWVRLRKVAGSTPEVGLGQVVRTDDKGAFSFADVAPGQYVLTFSASEPKAAPAERSSENLGGLQNQINTLSDRTGTNIARISFSGAAGGKVEKDLPIKVKQAPADGQRLGLRIDTVEADPSSDRLYGPGATHWGNVSLRIDDGPRKLLHGHVSLIK